MSADQAQKAQVTTPTDRTIRIERYFDAPRDRVYATMMDPELIPEWWGPHGTTTEVDKMDVRTGGDWRFVCRDPERGDTAFRGSYREVVPGERVVQTFEWEGMPGYISLETAEFQDHGDRTLLVSESVFFHPEERDGMLESGMEGGMNETYERFDALLARA